MKTFPFQPNLIDFTIIDHSLLPKDHLLYHGTSDIYSKDIESEGLKKDHLQFGEDNFSTALALLKKLKEIFPNEQEISKYIDTIENQTAIHSISMTILGYEAVQYATAPYKGGQAIKLLKQANDTIEKFINQLGDDNQDKLKLSIDFSHINESMCSFNKKLKLGNGVIYLIQVDEQLLKTLTKPNGPVHADQNIPVKNIVGKVIIPPDFGFDLSLKSSIRNAHAKLRDTPGSIANYLTKKHFDLN